MKQAQACWDVDDYAGAAKHFQTAREAMPSSWESQFGLGVAMKWLCRWEECLEASQNATQLSSDSIGAWWNIGIAGTALGKWRLARQAWRAANIDVDIDDTPLEMQAGQTPARLKTTNGEVVWCHRIDPARARIINVPTPEREHRYGDVILLDGEPVGSRRLGQRDYPVLNELQILETSYFSTFVVEIENASLKEAQALEMLSTDDVHIEDWYTIRTLCKACSEGTPHEHHDDDDVEEFASVRPFAFAARTADDVASILTSWQKPSFVRFGPIQCLLQAR
jgi:tetratricopeptide (TPR) repeat protein